MTTTQYLRAFARSWWLIGLCVVVGTVLPMLVTSTAKKYVSSTSVVVTGTPGTQGAASDAYQVTLLAQQRMSTYEDVASSPQLAQVMLEDYDTDLTATQLTDRITAVVQGSSTVLRITVEDTEANRAQLLAGRAGDAMVDIIDRLEKVQGQSSILLKAKVLAQASAPSVSGTTAWRNPSLGGATGLLVGLALAVAISRLNPRLRDPDTVADLVGAPVLGLLPMARSKGRLTKRRHRSRHDEAVREIRTGIFFLRKDTDGCLTVAIISATQVPGLARITRSVAEALVDTGARVLVVEVELDAPDDVSARIAQHDEAAGFDVVRAGTASAPGIDVFGPQGFAALLGDATEHYDYVLVTAPAKASGTDAAAVAARCSATVLVVRTGTRETQLRDALRHLKGVDASVRGVVLLT